MTRADDASPPADAAGAAERSLAIIDLGSNTAKMIALAYRPNDRYRHLDQLRQVVRLSAGMGPAKIIRADAFERGLTTLALFRAYCEASGIDEVRATATSAVREAANGASFVAAARERAGVELDVLGGEAEAACGVLAVANSVALDDALVLDLGGGSVQLSLMQGRRFVRGDSWPLGAVKATEAFFEHDPPREAAVAALAAATRERVGAWLEGIPAGLPLVGMGGTLRNLANVQQKREAYPVDLLHGYRFASRHLDEVVTDLLATPTDARRGVSGLNSDRADIIAAGGVVIREVVEAYGADELLISGQGLREGLFYPYLFPDGEHLAPDVRAFSVRNLMRQYYDHPAHNEHVRRLALALFDGLRERHGYGGFERELLGAAALLHDIGMAVDYYGHHKHALYLTMGHALPGFSHREQVLIGLLARYHRKGSPSDKGYGDVLEDGDMPRLRCLAGILRLAEYLERSKAQKVREVRCHLGDGYLQIEARADGDARVEVQEANRRSGLLAEALQLEVEVVPGYGA